MKNVIITGGNRGIGLDITRRFIDLNCNVISVSKSGIYEDSFYSPYLSTITCDLTNESSFAHISSFLASNKITIDCLVNNAGLSCWKRLQDIDRFFLDHMFSTNVYSAFLMSKACLPFMRNPSTIVNISSIAGKRGSKNNSVYAASKFAMNGMTQSLAKELGRQNIYVNALCPVLIKTSGLLSALEDDAAPGEDPHSFINDFAAIQTATGNLPLGSQIAELTAYIGLTANPAFTGQCINVDSGVLPQ